MHTKVLEKLVEEEKKGKEKMKKERKIDKGYLAVALFTLCVLSCFYVLFFGYPF